MHLFVSVGDECNPVSAMMACYPIDVAKSILFILMNGAVPSPLSVGAIPGVVAASLYVGV